MTERPDVDWQRAPHDDEPVILMLPGGKASSEMRPIPLSTAKLRMRPFSQAVKRHLPGVAVGTVNYRHRGWNAPRQDPADDVRAVLDGLTGSSPVALLGHSMGGRAAIAAADHHRVTGVVGFAPWLPNSDGVASVRGRTVILAHGSTDRLVHPKLSAAWAQRAQGVPDRLARFVVRGDDHTMLWHASLWNALAVAGCSAALGLSVDPQLQDGFDAAERGEFSVPLHG
ncbi:MAG: alpha/beta hydrolase [Mycobacteriaceae bacterium]